MKVIDFLKRENWTKNATARNVYGDPCNTFDLGACSFCLFGAIIKCYGVSHKSVSDKVYSVLGNEELISVFNDTHSWEEVSDLIKVCDI